MRCLALTLAALALAACGGAEADEETIALARQAYEREGARRRHDERARLGVIKSGAAWPTSRTIRANQ